MGSVRLRTCDMRRRSLSYDDLPGNLVVVNPLFVNPAYFLRKSAIFAKQWQACSLRAGNETRLPQQTTGYILSPYFFRLLATTLHFGIGNVLFLALTWPADKLSLCARKPASWPHDENRSVLGNEVVRLPFCDRIVWLENGRSLKNVSSY